MATFGMQLSAARKAAHITQELLNLYHESMQSGAASGGSTNGL